MQTPFNVGSIERTAAAMRVDDVWLSGSTADPDHERTRKTALGSDRFLTFHRVESPVAAVEAARATGYRIVGIELADDAVPLPDADLDGDVCLLVGHEDRIGSLNVATATAIALYEVRRRAWT